MEKMADDKEAHVESALKRLIEITELGGYMKNEVKEDIRKAVSVLKNCFNALRNDQKHANIGKQINQKEDKGSQTDEMAQGEDSCHERQVAPSIDETPEATNVSLPKPTSGGEESNDQSTEAHKTLEDKITAIIGTQIHAIMENMTMNMRKMIREENESVKQQVPTTTNVWKVPHNSARERALQHVAGEGEPPLHTNDSTQGHQDEIQMDTTEEEQWTQVTHRRRRQPARQRTPTIGTGPGDGDLQAVEKKAWLFVGRLKQGTTTEAIKNFLTRKGITENVICEELATNYNTKSFKVGVPFSYLETVNKTDFWPAGITIKRFQFFRRNAGISLE